MAEPIAETVGETVKEAVVNATAGTKVPSTPEGMAIAYGSLVIMALFPIIIGSFRSVRHHKEQKASYKESGEKPDTMTQKDAAMFPIIASGALFGLYIFFQVKICSCHCIIINHLFHKVI